ncbi:MAG TPA: hypothetical protein VJV75_04140, partial [Candidatus Polarisedimenticolia bacterium]|nr:hypothetical protein [Candidatus Polarisedimenticolia bacterium]
AAAARPAIDRLLERVEGALAAANRREGAAAGADWVSRFGTRAEPALVAEITRRAAKAMVPSRHTCLMPDLIPVRDAAGNVVDARVVPATDFTVQMLRWSGKLPFEPAP